MRAFLSIVFDACQYVFPWLILVLFLTTWAALQCLPKIDACKAVEDRAAKALEETTE